MFDPTPSRDRGKPAVAKTVRTRRGVSGWPDILRVLHIDETRSLVLGLYRDRGHTPDAFAWSRAAREAMADALTRAEDVLELRGIRRDAERIGIRDIRQRLERELWR